DFRCFTIKLRIWCHIASVTRLKFDHHGRNLSLRIHRLEPLSVPPRKATDLEGGHRVHPMRPEEIDELLQVSSECFVLDVMCIKEFHRRSSFVRGRTGGKPGVGNLLQHRRMRLYRCRLDMRACHPAENSTRRCRRGFHAPSLGLTSDCRVLADGICGRKDRKSTRLNSSHVKSSYAVFCLK